MEEYTSSWHEECCSIVKWEQYRTLRLWNVSCFKEKTALSLNSISTLLAFRSITLQDCERSFFVLPSNPEGQIRCFPLTSAGKSFWCVFLRAAREKILGCPFYGKTRQKTAREARERGCWLYFLLENTLLRKNVLSFLNFRPVSFLNVFSKVWGKRFFACLTLFLRKACRQTKNTLKSDSLYSCKGLGFLDFIGYE